MHLWALACKIVEIKSTFTLIYLSIVNFRKLLHFNFADLLYIIYLLKHSSFTNLNEEFYNIFAQMKHAAQTYRDLLNIRLFKTTNEEICII